HPRLLPPVPRAGRGVVPPGKGRMAFPDLRLLRRGVLRLLLHHAGWRLRGSTVPGDLHLGIALQPTVSSGILALLDRRGPGPPLSWNIQVLELSDSTRLLRPKPAALGRCVPALGNLVLHFRVHSLCSRSLPRLGAAG